LTPSYLSDSLRSFFFCGSGKILALPLTAVGSKKSPRNFPGNFPHFGVHLPFRCGIFRHLFEVASDNPYRAEKSYLSMCPNRYFLSPLDPHYPCGSGFSTANLILSTTFATPLSAADPRSFPFTSSMIRRHFSGGRPFYWPESASVQEPDSATLYYRRSL